MKCFCVLLSCLLSLPAISQHLRYSFSAPNANHHEAEITVVADGLKGPAVFKMSRASPGRYARHEFGKNIYNVLAFNTSGEPLKIEKEDADSYRVTGHKGTVKLTYTLFGDYADGTYASVDATGYHLNMPASFMWVKGLENAPITIQFSVPVPAWKIATQLQATKDSFTFTAPNLQYFMDSPTKIGELQVREWTVTNSDQKQYTFRLALEATATPALVDSFTEKLKRIVNAGKEVYGEFPPFDYGTYTFIASINPWVKGDGMEHRNSTMITIPDEFDGDSRLLGVFAHEFFHCWNVERIRPKSLEPFNFEKSNMSEALWLAEGFTQYYGSLLRMRAGLMSEAEFEGNMAGLVNAKANTPGAQLYSPVENSQRAVFVDAGVSIDRTNYPNMYTSYYLYGGAMALALDLELRSKFHSSLDELMKALWRKQGKPEIPYTLADVQAALSSVANATYAAGFFKNYIYGHETPDYTQLLRAAGYSVSPINSGKGSLGKVALDSTGNGLMVARNTVRNTPLYNAGLDAGDLIGEVDGKFSNGLKRLNEVLYDRKPGEKVPITFFHHGSPVKTTVTLAEDPFITIEKIKGTPGIENQLAQDWLRLK